MSVDALHEMDKIVISLKIRTYKSTQTEDLEKNELLQAE